MRFRLRFLLQEHDLPPGETILGRSPDCHITIEDPLISRQHARIVVEQGVVTFHDLGSRNGSRINGRPISGSQVLADQDRVRLGAQELVFFRMETSQFAPRSTGADEPSWQRRRSQPHGGSTLMRIAWQVAPVVSGGGD